MSGRLARSKVSIKQDSSLAGDEAPDYTGDELALSLPADIQCVSGQENYRGRQLEATVDYVVETRYRSDAKPSMQVCPTEGIFSGLTLNVEYVQQVGYQRGRLPKTLWFCKTVAAT